MSVITRLLNLIPEAVSGYRVLAFLVVFNIVVVITAKWSKPNSTLNAIPTVGSTTWLGSWLDGLKFPINGVKVIQQGYDQYNGAPFKIATLFSWIVVLSSHEHIEELRRAPDDTVSLDAATAEEFQIDYTMSPRVHQNSYHVQVARAQLTRNIGSLYPELRNEITTAFDDIVDLKGNEWKSVYALNSMQKIACRTNNRMFVGLPLCRDLDWIDLNIQFTLLVGKGSIMIRLFPDFLKPLIAWLWTRVTRCNERARKLVGPMIEERQKYLNEYGQQWEDKPNDFLSWLMDKAKPEDSTVAELTTRILAVNFAATHTSSLSLTHALFYLAANPQYIQPLREEVEMIVREEGWSKAAVNKMYRVDSFLKECQRLQGFSFNLSRKALKNFTLSGGTIIPKGTRIIASTRAIHHDEKYYPNARAFEPFRFFEMEEKDKVNTKHQLVSTTAKYLAFGHGHHACPGRFFTGVELKTMLAHVVQTYDVKLEDDATHPEARQIGPMMWPDQNVKVMFRTRAH